MKFSYRWLRELVDGLDIGPKELGRLITMKTAECEGVEEVVEPSPDWIVEIDNKSLTHRPDLWGHYGMAREVAAITGRTLRDPVALDRLPKGSAPVGISIEDFTLCPRYSALVFENVTVQPSPLWLQDRLEVIGLNPIGNIVDVTNFIMAELAQPMHAFDAGKLKGSTIYARPARAGEHIAALNGETYDLTPDNLVIADAGGPIALAGVIGGQESAISDSTTRIVLESACFQAASIRKTSSRLKLRTDASMRFEKAQDPVNTIGALARAIELLEVVSPGIRIIGGLADAYQPLPVPPPIELPLDWLDRKLGLAIPAAEVRRILESLSFVVKDTAPRVFSVTVPSWRATKDISIKEDLVEEVGRMVGYDSITPAAPLVAATVPPANPARVYDHHVRDLVAAQGFTEVYNYSFLSEDTARRLHLDPAAHIAVANPISSEQGLLRMSLLPGIWRNILDNARHFDAFRLFEIGREIHKQPEGLPREVPHLMAAMYAKDSREGSLFELKRLAECLGATRVRPAEPRAIEHPMRAADVLADDTVVGRLFELHPSLIEAGRAAVLDIDLTRLQPFAAREKRYRTLRRFPTSVFDLSIVTEARHLAGDIQDELAACSGDELVSIEFLRQYTGPPLPEGTKSVSFRLTIGAADHTLSPDEVTAARNRVIAAMRARGFDLRV